MRRVAARDALAAVERRSRRSPAARIGVVSALGSGTARQVTPRRPSTTAASSTPASSSGQRSGGEPVEEAVGPVLGEVHRLILAVDADGLVVEAAERGPVLAAVRAVGSHSKIRPPSTSSQVSQVSHGVGPPAQLMLVSPTSRYASTISPSGSNRTADTPAPWVGKRLVVDRPVPAALDLRVDERGRAVREGREDVARVADGTAVVATIRLVKPSGSSRPFASGVVASAAVPATGTPAGVVVVLDEPRGALVLPAAARGGDEERTDAAEHGPAGDEIAAEDPRAGGHAQVRTSSSTASASGPSPVSAVSAGATRRDATRQRSMPGPRMVVGAPASVRSPSDRRAGRRARTPPDPAARDRPSRTRRGACATPAGRRARAARSARG